MQNILETVSVIVSLVALCLVLLVVAVNLYFLKRNGYQVSVNCWFCNIWTKVPFEKRNCWDCPSCCQYNGFNKDGGYNKVIEAQHTVAYSRLRTIVKTEPVTNGLCTYCNNNQQLKMYQLANFTPLNEENYDVEVEHFQKQLEKAYKLCKKCEKVLKTTIDRQHAWLFGNRLRNLQKRSLSLINLTKSSKGLNKKHKQSIFSRLIRYTLVLLTALIVCNVLKIKMDYSTDLKQIIPQKYDVIINDIYETVNNHTHIINKEIQGLNKYLPKNMKIQSNTLVLVSTVGFLLECVLAIFERKTLIWKIIEMLCWTTLLITSGVTVAKNYHLFISVLQVLSSFLLLYSYMTSAASPTHSKRKFEFKKIGRLSEQSDASEDEDVEEEENYLSMSEASTVSFRENNTSSTYRRSSPITANNKKTMSTSLNGTVTFHNDLNRSLSNLKLDVGESAPLYSIRKPLLSPPKLNNMTHNSWTAGGFWKNDFSRSSSQSSGFVSHQDVPFNSLPASREPSVCGDVERDSIVSEPPYHFQPVNNMQSKSSFTNTNLYYKGENNTFYPVLSQNNMLLLNCSQGIGGTFSMKSVSFNPGMLFCEKPLYRASPSPNFKRM